jgi:hypothetical protein
VRLRLLNPDHSPYELHGQDWSATFRLGYLGSPPTIAWDRLEKM